MEEHSGENSAPPKSIGSIAEKLADAGLNPTDEERPRSWADLTDREKLESERVHFKSRIENNDCRARLRESKLVNKAKEAELAQLRAENEALTLRHEVEHLKQQQLQQNQQPGGRGGLGNAPPNKHKRQYQGPPISRAQSQLLLNALAPGHKRQRGGWGGRGGRGGRGSDQQDAPAPQDPAPQ